MPLIAAGKKAIRIYERQVGKNELQKGPHEIEAKIKEIRKIYLKNIDG